MISVKKVSHSFSLGKKGQKTMLPVLKDVSFHVKRGEIIAVVGKSGSGKSTLLNLISGFIRPDEGEVWLDGQQVTTFTEADFADFRLNHLGFIFQNFQLIPSMTAYENVEMPLVLQGEKEAERKKRVVETLERVGMVDFQHHYPSELSGGQQQRISIARALILNPPIILADEPTGSLDSETEADLLNFICQLNEEIGTTFLVITHDEEVAAIANRKISIRDGSIVEEGVLL